ncbi:MAG: NirD/YgiW/YdeI family stress tolerance protein [Alphaproteobacteria bacterium]|nr:NirD/YgiW/YdeI family stress tolerance protein [Alphaproteobacteria bacterium]
MKNFILIAAFIFALVFAFVAGVARANGDDIGDHVTIVSVENVRQFRNGSYVILEGRIERYIDKDMYVFEDDTGSIIVKITPEKISQFSARENDRVRIRGEIERARFSRPTIGAIKVEIID